MSHVLRTEFGVRRLAACDDSQVDRMLLEIAAANAGVGSDVVADRSKLLELLSAGVAQGAPHWAILCDLNMPGLGLGDFMKTLRTQPSLAHLPVVVWSDEITGLDSEGLVSSGVHRVVAKPAGLAETEEILKGLAHEFEP